MRARDDRNQIELLQGTLDMLILRTLIFGPAHGHRIAHSIEHTSGDVLKIDHGSLYPALQRLERRGWVTAEWGASENNRRAKYYRLTPAGRTHLATQAGTWERLTQAIAQVMNPPHEEET